MKQTKPTGTEWVPAGEGSTVADLLRASETGEQPQHGDTALYTALLLTGRVIEPIDERRIVDAVRWAREGRP